MSVTPQAVPKSCLATLALFDVKVNVIYPFDQTRTGKNRC
jgi:hypothetical protein